MPLPTRSLSIAETIDVVCAADSSIAAASLQRPAGVERRQRVSYAWAAVGTWDTQGAEPPDVFSVRPGNNRQVLRYYHACQGEGWEHAVAFVQAHCVAACVGGVKLSGVALAEYIATDMPPMSVYTLANYIGDELSARGYVDPLPSGRLPLPGPVPTGSAAADSDSAAPSAPEAAPPAPNAAAPGA